MAELWNLELELKVLKSILTPGSEWGAKLFSASKPEFFNTKIGKAIYGRVKALFDSGQVELPSYDFLLQDQKIPENIRVTASEAFRDMQIVESAGDFEYATSQLNQIAKKRKIYEAAAEAANTILDDGEDSKDKKKKRASTLQDITERLGETILSVDDEDGMTTHVQMGRGYNQEAEDAFYNILYGTFATSMIKTGFQEFDSRTGGHNRSNLVVVGGNSGGGKSLFAVNLLVRQYRLGYNVVLVSYEMTEEEVLIRLMSCISEVPMNKILTHSTTDEEEHRIELAWREFNLQGAEKGNSYSIICPKDETTIPEIGFRVRSLHPDSLILDYINLLTTAGGKQSDNTAQWQQLGQIAREAKVLANKLNCVVYLLAQIDESLNLRYSKGIKDHANFVMGWVTDEAALKERIITVQQMKARNAPVYPFVLHERFDIAQFRDPGQEDRIVWPDDAQYAQMLDRLNELGAIKKAAALKKKEEENERLKAEVESSRAAEAAKKPVEVVKESIGSSLLWSAKDISPIDPDSLQIDMQPKSVVLREFSDTL